MNTPNSHPGFRYINYVRLGTPSKVFRLVRGHMDVLMTRMSFLELLVAQTTEN